MKCSIVLNEHFKNRKTERAVEHSPFLKKIATYQSVSESVSEMAKLIRGDPPKIDFKKKGEPPKKGKICYLLVLVEKHRCFEFKKIKK